MPHYTQWDSFVHHDQPFAGQVVTAVGGKVSGGWGRHDAGWQTAVGHYVSEYKLRRLLAKKPLCTRTQGCLVERIVILASSPLHLAFLSFPPLVLDVDRHLLSEGLEDRLPLRCLSLRVA